MSHGNKCSHDENRKKICAPCGRKIVFGKVKPENFVINNKIANLINKYSSTDFDLSNEKYPLSICRSCYLTLLDFEKEIYNRQIQIMPDYKNIVLPKETRSTKDTCNCYICSTATCFGHVNVKKGKGNFRELRTNIDVSGQCKNSVKKVDEVSVLSENNKKSPDVIKVCSKCFQNVGKGINHECKNPKENLLKLVDKLPQKSKEQVASSIIKSKYDSTIELNEKSQSITLATGGRKRKLIFHDNIKTRKLEN